MRTLTVSNEELFASVSKALSEGKEAIIPSKGISMLPFIRGGRDQVALVRPETLRKGDIVLFRYAGRHILHRITKVLPGGEYEIMGDGVVSNREKCPAGDIDGVAVAIIKDGEKRIDPYTTWRKFLLAVWNLLRPVRRYLLAIYRHLPWNGWLREQLASQYGK